MKLLTNTSCKEHFEQCIEVYDWTDNKNYETVHKKKDQIMLADNIFLLYAEEKRLI